VSFDVGNVSGGSFGQSSSVALLIPGAGQFTFVNSTPGTTMNWQRFSVEYVADAVSSGFFFWNLDPEGDNVNGLDNVVVEAVLPTAVVPVPGALSLLLGGVGLLAGFAARRRG
jgi:hypothetical protein